MGKESVPTHQVLFLGASDGDTAQLLCVLQGYSVSVCTTAEST